MSDPLGGGTPLVKQRISCMEVWGGNGAAQQHFELPGLDIWLSSTPEGNAEVDGGDVHLISSCASGRTTRMLLADICSQGSTFAQLAADFRRLMMRNINSVRQAAFVNDMNRVLNRLSDHGGFATTLIATFFAPTRSFSLCNVGHSLPLLYRAHVGEWAPLKGPTDSAWDPSGLAGVLNRSEYQQLSTRLEIGDMILGYSSALSECTDRNGQTVGVDGLIRRVEQFDPNQPAEIIAALHTELRSSHSSNLEQCDATFMLCRAADRKVSWKNNLLAPFRYLGKVKDGTRLA